jgi:hypothetical protein
MATSAAVGPVQRRAGHIAVGPTTTERSADPRASRRRPVPGLLRPSQAAEPGGTSQVTGVLGARSGTDLDQIPVHPSGADRPAVARQPSVGNAAVSRLLSQGRHAPAGVQRSSVHDVLRGPGQPLPASSRKAEANAHRIMAGGDRFPALPHAMGTSDGEATPARGGEQAAVQRYVEIEPGAHNYPGKYQRDQHAFLGWSESAENDEQFFPSQHEKVFPREPEEGGSYSSYFDRAEKPRTANITYSGSVRLRFSDSFDLAIEQGTGESKVFFATAAHIRAANKALTGRVRFQQGTHYLRVRGPWWVRRLYQVEPVVETERTGEAGTPGVTEKATGLSILTPQRCNEMAEFVTGKVGLDLTGGSSWDNFVARVLDIVENSGSQHLDGVEAAFKKARSGKSEDQKAYVAYSAQMSRTFQDLKVANSLQLEAALRTLGLNQFLPPPPPGSAMAVFGLGDAEQEAYRRENKTRIGAYHFGAVVATSGGDYVTMENRVRFDPIVGNATASRGDPLFYFKMYGTKPESGETWHSARVSSGKYIGAILSITIKS